MAKTAQDHLVDWLAAHGPDDWHRVALAWNWDQGYRILTWVVDQRACDKGTALQLFWLGSPDYFLAFQNRDAVLAKAPWSIENYDFLVRVLTHWREGHYTTAAFATEGVAEMAAAFGHVESEQAADTLPWIVPSDMRRDVQGKTLDRSEYVEGYPPALVQRLRAAGIEI